MAQDEVKTLEYALTKRAWTDINFRNTLVQNSTLALKQLGVEVPSGVKVVVKVQRPDTLYYMIPPLAQPEQDLQRPINQTDFWKSGDIYLWIVPEPLKVALLQMRQAFRKATLLIDNPKEGLKEHFGCVPGDGKCNIEIVVQDSDTITILLPCPPEGSDTGGLDRQVDAASSRVYDVLFDSGIGGFFIPSTAMTWVLRDFRSKVAGMKAPASGQT